MNLTIEQWSVLYQLWKEDGKSQQELCNATFRDKPSITRLIDNLEKQIGYAQKDYDQVFPFLIRFSTQF